MNTLAKSDLFRAAHDLARRIRQAGDDYRVTFGACLRSMIEKAKLPEIKPDAALIEFSWFGRPFKYSEEPAPTFLSAGRHAYCGQNGTFLLAPAELPELFAYLDRNFPGQGGSIYDCHWRICRTYTSGSLYRISSLTREECEAEIRADRMWGTLESHLEQAA